MISVAVRERSDKIAEFTARENECLKGELTGIKEGANLHIKEIKTGEKGSLTELDEEDKLVLELLIKACVNYCINRDILNIILEKQNRAKIFYLMGFKELGHKMALNVPLQMAIGCRKKQMTNFKK